MHPGTGRRVLVASDLARLLVGLAPLCAAPGAALGQAGPDSVVYVLAPSSRFDVTTGRAGLLGFAGHEHLIRARSFTGRILYFPAAPTRSHVEIVVATAGLEVLTPPDTEEIRKVTEAMRGEVLDVTHYPEMRFTSRSVTPTAAGFRIVAALTLRGRTRDLPVDVRVAIQADTLRATASFAVNQTDFGIRPYRGGPGGTVRVADRVAFDIEAVAVREGR